MDVAREHCHNGDKRNRSPNYTYAADVRICRLNNPWKPQNMQMRYISCIKETQREKSVDSWNHMCEHFALMCCIRTSNLNWYTDATGSLTHSKQLLAHYNLSYVMRLLKWIGLLQ